MKLIIIFNVLFQLLLPLLSMCTASIKEKVCGGGSVNRFRIHRFKDCTRIVGILHISEKTFYGDETIPEMDPSELEVFSTVREMTDLYIEKASHPEFTDLHYFRNLETIDGRPRGRLGNGDLKIFKTSLKSLGLRSLRKMGGVYIKFNKNLCFAEGIDWSNLMNSTHIPVEHNRPKNDCVAENMVCHKGCSMDGCWGPSVDECLSCVMVSPEKTCLDSCSYPGMYQLDNQICGKCHEQCNKTCTGPNPWNCVKCIKDGPYCVARCPIKTYNINDDCLPCNEKCANGCTGPGNFVGFRGCDTCHNAVVYSDNSNEITRIMCQQANEPCEEGYYSDLVRVTDSSEDLKSLAAKFICLKCVHLQSDTQCEDRCPTGYYMDYITKRCLRCSFECKECWGPGWDQCKTCLMLKVPLGENITNEFNCSDKCPYDKPHIMQDHDGPYCSAFKPAENGDINVPAIVGGVLGCTLLIGILVTVVVYQCWRRAKPRESTLDTMMVSRKDPEQLIAPHNPAC